MRRNGIEVDSFTLPTILKACNQESRTQLGEEIHGFVLKNGFESDVFVTNALIQMYSECGNIGSARLVFDKMSEKDVVSWSTMIRSYHKGKLLDDALEIVREMLSVKIRPSEVAMVSMVSLFADIADFRTGKAMHAFVMKNSKNENLGLALATSLIGMYAKCGDLATTKRVFDALEQKSVVSWTVMIVGYVRCGQWREGVGLIVEMMEENLFPTEIMMRSLIIECGFIGVVELGKLLHAYVLRNGFALSMASANALVDMYGKCGEVRSAKAMFDIMEEKDVMTWNNMILAYTQSHLNDKAFELFVQMRKSEVGPNERIIFTLLSLCAEDGALHMGKWVHGYIKKQGVEVDVKLKTAIVDMYAKCGDVNGAYRLFSEALHQDLWIWNVMMGGYGMHGYGNEAFKLFSDMERFGAKPNDITFIGLLNACSHGGLVSEGKRVFNKMVNEYGLVLKIEHYGCMVDLLGRAGLLDEAYETIKGMPMRPNTIIWGALMAACKLHKNFTMAEMAGREIIEMEPESCGYNVLMSNVYAGENRWDDVVGVRRGMKGIRLSKEPGLSYIEVNGLIHEFVTGDITHLETEKIHDMLTELSSQMKEGELTAENLHCLA